MNKRNEGITLVALVITIIVLIIVAGITLNFGNEAIQKAKMENLKTNMLLIQAKTKEYLENTNFKKGKETDPVKITEIKKKELKGTPIEMSTFVPPAGVLLKQGEEPYSLSSSDMETLGLKDLATYANDYVVLYNIKDITADIIYKPGIKYEGNMYYVLSKLEEISMK